MHISPGPTSISNFCFAKPNPLPALTVLNQLLTLLPTSCPVTVGLVVCHGFWLSLLKALGQPKSRPYLSRRPRDFWNNSHLGRECLTGMPSAEAGSLQAGITRHVGPASPSALTQLCPRRTRVEQQCWQSHQQQRKSPERAKWCWGNSECWKGRQ